MKWGFVETVVSWPIPMGPGFEKTVKVQVTSASNNKKISALQEIKVATTPDTSTRKRDSADVALEMSIETANNKKVKA